MLKGYPIKITRKTIHTYDGEMFLGKDCLYFFPKGKENVLKTIAIRSGHKLAFDLRTSDRHSESIENANEPSELTEDNLEAYFQSQPEAMKFEANKIDKLQHNWIRRVIKYDGKNHGLPDGISKELRAALKPWAQQNNVTTKGF